MSVELDSVKLKDVCFLSTEKVSVKDIDECDYISTDSMEPNLGRVYNSKLPPSGRVTKFSKGDVLFANIRPYFRKVWFATKAGACSSDVLVFRPKNPLVFDSRFLYYILADKRFIDHTMASAKGAKMPRGDKSAMLEYGMPDMPLTAQSKISQVLGGLDDYSDSLFEESKVLESIAQTLFKSWFINFDPVHAKAAGLEPEGMSPELAALFPSEFEESELGQIPKGWEVQSVSSFLKRHKTKTRYDSKDCINETGVPIFDQSASVFVGYAKQAGEVPSTLESPSFIFGDHTCVTRLHPEPFNISANVIALAGDTVDSYWAFFAIKDLQKFESYRRHWSELSVKKVAVPPTILTEQFGRSIQPLYAQIVVNQKLSFLLGQARDELLPRLISGKLRIEEAEEAVSEVLGTQSESEEEAA